jgi:hypothetical protein
MKSTKTILLILLLFTLTLLPVVAQAQVDSSKYENIDKYRLSPDEECLDFVSNLVYMSASDFWEDDGYNDTLKPEKVKKTDFAFFDISKNNDKSLIAFTACLIISRFDCKRGYNLHIYNTKVQKMIFFSSTQNYQSLEFIKKDNNKSAYFKELIISSRDDDDNCVYTALSSKDDSISSSDISLCRFPTLPLALLVEIQKDPKKREPSYFLDNVAQNVTIVKVKKKWKKKVYTIGYLDKIMTFNCDKDCIKCQLINERKN